MSLVSVVLKDKHITVMTDGRVVDKDLKPIDEMYKKVRFISPKQFVGFAGNKDFCEKVAKNIPYVESAYDLELLSDIIFKTAQDFTGIHLLKWNFVLGGIDKDDLITACYFNHRSIEVQSFKPANDEINYLFLHNGIDGTEISIENVFENFLKERKNDSVFSFYDAQKKFNDYVASIDPSVNTNVFKERIRKK